MTRENQKIFLRTFVLYALIGAVSAATDAGIFYLLFQKAGLNEFFSNAVSVHCGIFLSFFLNRNFNFRKTDQTGKRFLSFYLTGLFGLALSSGILWIGNRLSLPPMATKLFSVAFIAVTQFLINRAVAFGDRKPKAS